MERLKDIYRGRPTYKYEDGVITYDSLDLLIEDMMLESDIRRELNQAEVGITRPEPVWRDR